MSVNTDQPSATRNRKSRWRIIAPLLCLPFVLPSTLIATIGALGAGAAAPNGALSSIDPMTVLFFALPTALWSAGWLFDWSGEYDVIETRVAFSASAAVISPLLCAGLYITQILQGLGEAHG